MFGLYDIYKGGEKIGKAEVNREGLYYRFRCHCNLPEGDIYRLYVTCGDRKEKLGIPIPGGDGFWLSVRLPVSRFSGEEPGFYAATIENKSWVPVLEDVPFPFISQLSDAVLEEKEGKMGLLISEAEKPDSDPNP